jgi:hypothetical protein
MLHLDRNSDQIQKPAVTKRYDLEIWRQVAHKVMWSAIQQSEGAMRVDSRSFLVAIQNVAPQ